MTEEVVVTRKGQITIPVKYRRRYALKEGSKLIVAESREGVLLKPVTPLEDLAGIDAGKISLIDALRIIDKMRIQDRY